MARKAKLYRLTEQQIKALKPKEKLYRASDGGGLYIAIKPNGSKFWQFRYNQNTKTVSYGTYPEVKLSAARERAAADRDLLAVGKDPAEEIKAREEARKKEEEERRRQESNTYEAIARDYIEFYRPQKAPKYWIKVEQAQERDVYPFIGRLFIDDVTPKKIIDIVKRIEERGAVESARRVHTQIRRIYEYAIAHQRATRNPASEINPSMIFQAPKKQHYDTITKPEGIGRLLLRLEAHEETAPIVSLALRFLALTAVRPGNIYQARREDFDMEAKLWRIPAEQSKTKEELLIPLSRQAIEIIEKVRLYTGETRLIFPSPAHISDPMNPNTLARTLTRMGYTKGAEENIVPHGFRSMFTTIANESGKDFLAIEAQQGHKIGNQVSQAYNRATYINQRRELMQWWADTLDEFKAKASENAHKEEERTADEPRPGHAQDSQQDQGTPTPKAG